MTDSRTLRAMNAPHWDAWSVENLPGLSESLKVAELVRWWKASMQAKWASQPVGSSVA